MNYTDLLVQYKPEVINSMDEYNRLLQIQGELLDLTFTIVEDEDLQKFLDLISLLIITYQEEEGL